MDWKIVIVCVIILSIGLFGQAYYSYKAKDDYFQWNERLQNVDQKLWEKTIRQQVIYERAVEQYEKEIKELLEYIRNNCN